MERIEPNPLLTLRDYYQSIVNLTRSNMNTKPTLIGIAGFAGAGKSTLAEILVHEHGFARIKFADGLKDMLRALGLGEEWIEGDLKEKPCQLLLGRSPRYAMQTLGTEWGRKCLGEDFWVNYWFARVQRHFAASPGARVVVDDVRYPNELQAVAGLNGRLWWVTRPGVRALGGHSSEHGLAGEFARFEEVHNSSGLAELAEVVRTKLKGGA